MQTYLFSSKKPVSIVRDLSEDEKPSERLTRFGPDSLSDAELLSILLQTGSKKIDGLETCRKLLHNSGGLAKLARKNWQEYKTDNIGTTRAQAITAAFELSRRLQASGNGNGNEKVYFKSPEDVAAYYGPRLRDKQTEQFTVCFLNAAKAMTGAATVSNGGKTATVVDPSEVMRQAILNEANSIIVVHNHPSANRRASRADIAITKKLTEAGNMLDIPVDDHVIIAGYDHLSMRAEGLI